MSARLTQQRRCEAINPERTHRCDLTAGHEGDHVGSELPVVYIDDPTWEARPVSDLRILAALPLIVAGELLAALTDLTDRAAAAVVGLG